MPAHPAHLRSPRTRPTRGSVVVAVVIAMVVVQLAVIGTVLGGAPAADIGQRRTESAQALYAAEAAANIALAELAATADADGDGAVGSVRSGSVTAGLLIGPARAAASIAASGSVCTVTAAGASGLARHDFTLVATPARKGTTPGLYVEYFDLGAPPGACANVDWSAPSAAGVLPNADLPASVGGTTRWAGGAAHRFALRYRGRLDVPAAGLWTFAVNSDDGSRLFINGALVVDNDGDHSATLASGAVTLPAGPADFELQFYENAGDSVLQAFWSGPTVPTRTLIPPSAFRCSPAVPLPAIAAANSISLAGNGVPGGLAVDAYDSRAGAYGPPNVLTSGFAVASNSTAPGGFALSQGARLSGDARSGRGSDPAAVVTTTDTATVSGARSAAALNLGVGHIGPSSGVPASAGAASVYFNYTVPPGTYHFSSAAVTGSAVLTFTGKTIVYIDGDVSITGSAKLDCQAGGQLIMYVGGNVTIDQSASLNMTIKDPDRATIYMHGAARTFTLAGSARACALIHNPFGANSIASAAAPAAEFSGALLGDSLTVTGPARLHADSAFGAPEGTAQPMQISSWAQTR